MFYLRFSEFSFLTAAFLGAGTLLPRVRLLAHPGILEGSWTFPGPRRDGNGESAPVASPSWGVKHQMLSLSLVYSDSQPPGTAYCCRVLFKSRWGEFVEKCLAPRRAKSQVPRTQMPLGETQSTCKGFWCTGAPSKGDEAQPCVCTAGSCSVCLLKRRQPCSTG